MNLLRSFFIVCLLFVAALFQSCSCSREGLHGAYRIGVDPQWVPLNFGAQEPYINGYTEEILLRVARHTGLQFERLGANGDSLLSGLQEGKYDAILCSLPPYNFNQALYDFSENFLDIGPVLIVSEASSYTELSQMKGNEIGLILNDPALLILQKQQDLIPRFYASISDLLNAVVTGEIEGALLNQIPAVNYVRDLYPDKLKIVSQPLTTEGLHLVVLKNQQKVLLKAFDQTIEQMRRKKKLQELQKKWNLS